MPLYVQVFGAATLGKEVVPASRKRPGTVARPPTTESNLSDHSPTPLADDIARLLSAANVLEQVTPLDHDTALALVLSLRRVAIGIYVRGGLR